LAPNGPSTRRQIDRMGNSMGVSARRWQRLLVPTGLVAVLVAASGGLTAAASPQQIDPLQKQVNAVHATGAVGVFAEVTSPHTRESARAGTAELGTGRPMPLNGRFRIGSATKTFTAAVVLQLVGQGRMSLDDTVERWLPGVVQGDGNNGSRITVRELLQHTSGIPEVQPQIPALVSADGYRRERFRSYTPQELVALAMQNPPTFPPGSAWSYSNTNYTLAAMIIQAVTGRTWAQEVNERIIGPLGLRDTSTPDASPTIRGQHRVRHRPQHRRHRAQLDDGHRLRQHHQHGARPGQVLQRATRRPRAGSGAAQGHDNHHTRARAGPGSGLRAGPGLHPVALRWQLLRSRRRAARVPELGRHHRGRSPDSGGVRHQRRRPGHPKGHEITRGPGTVQAHRLTWASTRSPKPGGHGLAGEPTRHHINHGPAHPPLLCGPPVREGRWRVDDEGVADDGHQDSA